MLQGSLRLDKCGDFSSSGLSIEEFSVKLLLDKYQGGGGRGRKKIIFCLFLLPLGSGRNLRVPAVQGHVRARR